jgi:hypothetical protein
MAGSLIKIDEEIVTSAVASVTLTGIDSTYDVYQVIFNNVVPVTDNVDLFCRVTESSTPNTTANYDYAVKLMRTASSFLNISNTNNTLFDFGNNIGTVTGEATNGTVYIFNANNSSEYTFITTEFVELNSSPELTSWTGGGVFTSTSSVNGLHFFFDGSSNIDNGTFTLYGLKK